MEKRILINRNRPAVQQFERKLKDEQVKYNEAVNGLEGTGLLIDDPEVLTKLALHYTKDSGLSKAIKIGKQLDLVGKWNEYSTVSTALDSLTFDMDVYTSTGKQIYIEEKLYQYAETEEEIQEYKKLKDVSEKLLALEIKRADIKEILRPYVFGWNVYDPTQTEIEIKKHYLVEGIQDRKNREKSRIHHAEQAKRIKEKQLA